MLLLLLAFLLDGAVGLLTDGRPYALSRGTLFGVDVLCVWGLSVWQRVVDKKSRNILVSIYLFLLLYSLLLVVKYSHALEGAAVGRYIWYGYYLPMTALPLLVFMLALRRTGRDGRRWNLLWVGCGVLSALIMTNDLHQLAFSFPRGFGAAEENYTHGPGYYICALWIVLLLTGALVLLLRKCRLELPGKAVFVPLAAPILGAVYGVLYILWPAFRSLWSVGTAFNFAIIGFLEGCIQIGLISTNNDYEGLFSLAELSAEIVNGADEPIYRAAGARHLTAEERALVKNAPVLLDENTRLSAREVSGGRCYWTDDLSRIRQLNAEQREMLERIQIRNELLKTENQVLAQQERTAAQNRLYDRIADLVRPQTVAILALLDEAERADEQRFRAAIARVCVLCAYIKRRSNMELMRDKSERMALEELRLALSESAASLRYCGMDVWLDSETEGMAAAETLVAIYAFFERVAESVLEDCRAMVIHLRRDEDGVELRLLLHSPSFAVGTFASAAEGGVLHYSCDGDDYVLSFRRKEAPEG